MKIRRPWRFVSSPLPPTIVAAISVDPSAVEARLRLGPDELRGRPIRVAVDHQRIELLLGGPEGGTEEVVVNGEPVRLTSGTPVEVGREGASPHVAPSSVT